MYLQGMYLRVVGAAAVMVDVYLIKAAGLNGMRRARKEKEEVSDSMNFICKKKSKRGKGQGLIGSYSVRLYNVQVQHLIWQIPIIEIGARSLDYL